MDRGVTSKVPPRIIHHPFTRLQSKRAEEGSEGTLPVSWNRFVASTTTAGSNQVRKSKSYSSPSARIISLPRMSMSMEDTSACASVCASDVRTTHDVDSCVNRLHSEPDCYLSPKSLSSLKITGNVSTDSACRENEGEPRVIEVWREGNGIPLTNMNTSASHIPESGAQAQGEPSLVDDVVSSDGAQLPGIQSADLAGPERLPGDIVQAGDNRGLTIRKPQQLTSEATGLWLECTSDTTPLTTMTPMTSHMGSSSLSPKPCLTQPLSDAIRLSSPNKTSSNMEKSVHISGAPRNNLAETATELEERGAREVKCNYPSPNCTNPNVLKIHYNEKTNSLAIANKLLLDLTKMNSSLNSSLNAKSTSNDIDPNSGLSTFETCSMGNDPEVNARPSIEWPTGLRKRRRIASSVSPPIPCSQNRNQRKGISLPQTSPATPRGHMKTITKIPISSCNEELSDFSSLDESLNDSPIRLQPLKGKSFNYRKSASQTLKDLKLQKMVEEALNDLRPFVLSSLTIAMAPMLKLYEQLNDNIKDLTTLAALTNSKLATAELSHNGGNIKIQDFIQRFETITKDLCDQKRSNVDEERLMSEITLEVLSLLKQAQSQKRMYDELQLASREPDSDTLMADTLSTVREAGAFRKNDPEQSLRTIAPSSTMNGREEANTSRPQITHPNVSIPQSVPSGVERSTSKGADPPDVSYSDPFTLR